MRKRISLDEPEIVKQQTRKPSSRPAGDTGNLPGISPFREILAGEGREDFFNYIEWLGLVNDPDPVVLSSMHHYFYDAEEMKNVKTVVNLIRLNHIKEIKDFLSSVSNILKPKCNLIGCFIDSRKHNPFVLRKSVSEIERKRTSTALENGIVSRIPFLNWFYSVIDSRTNKRLSKNNVTLLLEDHGFKVLDMTELNGITYFHAKRKPKTAENKI
jgi:hypothetical protein